MASFVNPCQPGVNLCPGLVSVGKWVVVGGNVEGASAVLGGERHGSALLFWCDGSRIWGKWGCAVGRLSVGGAVVVDDFAG